MAVEHDASEDPIVGPARGVPTEIDTERPITPRLSRHAITLSDGHEVGVAVSGRGIPLVVVHGFSAEGILYAQSLSRLVAMGYRVVAIDVAGHGGTWGLPETGAHLTRYAELVHRTLDEIGIRRAVLAGHSMGGRLVTELTARHPGRSIALILLDAIVGDAWDRIVQWSRRVPPLLGGVGAVLAVDTASTLPFFRDRHQAAKLLRLATPTLTSHAVRPWRLLGPVVSILRSGSSDDLLDAVGEAGVPVFVIHGDRDLAVPLSTARSAARRTDGQLVVVRGGSHSWLLKDPETLPAIIYELLGDGLGSAQRRALSAAGLVPGEATIDDVERAFLEPDARVLELSPHGGPGTIELSASVAAHQPRYRWELVESPA